MVSAIVTFKCHQCGHKFKGPYAEYKCTVYAHPHKCPRCSSWHTMPHGLIWVPFQKPFYKKIWKELDSKQN